MGKDQVMGWAILLGSIVGVALYFYLVFMSSWAMLTVQVSVFLAVGGVLAIVAWIGYTLATTPTLEPFKGFEGLSEDEEGNESKAEDERGD